jgi:hypothetical protein
MRFLPTGPDIPLELISAQEKGQTIFVCGAGVSRGAGLPLFRGLVEGVYQHLGEDWNLHPAEREGMRAGGALEGQYDRVLRCLERRLVASGAPRNRGMRERIRAAVRHVLTPPDNVDLANHLALLELSRDAEGGNRILTTNFDTLFERAWYGKHQSAIATHAGMAMPQPKVATCTGVLHLHGRLADPRPELAAPDTDLVLTSAEFGDAYLRSGWASRYIYDLVRAYTVVLVGYQADDPPMRYLLEALEADRERYPDLQMVYAFASCEAVTKSSSGPCGRPRPSIPSFIRSMGAIMRRFTPACGNGGAMPRIRRHGAASGCVPFSPDSPPLQKRSACRIALACSAMETPASCWASCHLLPNGCRFCLRSAYSTTAEICPVNGSQSASTIRQ